MTTVSHGTTLTEHLNKTRPILPTVAASMKEHSAKKNDTSHMEA
jgi:hypothetical protein